MNTDEELGRLYRQAITSLPGGQLDPAQVRLIGQRRRRHRRVIGGGLTVAATLTAVTLAASLMLPNPTLATPTGPSPTLAGPAGPSTTPTPTEPAGETVKDQKVTRAMTKAEITDQTAQCLKGADGLKEYRRGDLKVRYAMIQAAVGYPSDSTPRTALLLEDDVAYYDCSGEYASSVGKGGDDVEFDPAAAGVEVPTLSGGSTGQCNGPKRSATIDSAAVLKTAAKARSARVTVRAAGGARTATLPVRNGYLYVATQLAGDSAWKPSKFEVELFNADGKRLPVQPYMGTVKNRLTYPLPPCTRTDR